MLVKLIEFSLPHGSGGMAAQMARAIILRRFERFRDEYGVEFKHFSTPYTLEVWFTKDSDYTLFFLTFDLNDGWRQYQYKEIEVDGYPE